MTTLTAKTTVACPVCSFPAEKPHEAHIGVHCAGCWRKVGHQPCSSAVAHLHLLTCCLQCHGVVREEDVRRHNAEVARMEKEGSSGRSLPCGRCGLVGHEEEAHGPDMGEDELTMREAEAGSDSVI